VCACCREGCGRAEGKATVENDAVPDAKDEEEEDEEEDETENAEDDEPNDTGGLRDVGGPKLANCKNWDDTGDARLGKEKDTEGSEEDAGMGVMVGVACVACVA